MRPRLLIPLLALTASAQDPWVPVLDALRDHRAPGRYLVAGIPSIEKGTSSFDSNLLQVRQLLAWHGKALGMLGKAAEGEARRQELETLRAGFGAALTTSPAE